MLSVGAGGIAVQYISIDWCNVYKFASEWQTFIAAVIALLAALSMNRIVRSQIQQAERHENERRRRRYIAARSTLPMVLTEICRYAMEVTNYLRPIHQQLTDAPEVKPPLPHPPIMPEQLFAAIERMIEAAEDERVVTHLRKIVSQIQILNSRLTDRLIERPTMMLVSTREIETNLRQCALIHATSGLLFPFARFQSEDLQETVEWRDLYNSLGILDIDSHTYSDLHNGCQRSQERGTSPEDI
jgi:hypothetical protein